MSLVKIAMAKGPAGYEYAMPMEGVKIVRYADDLSYVIADVPGGVIGVDGVSGALAADYGERLVPEEITKWQALTIINKYGLYDAVSAYVAAIPTDTTEGRQVHIDFNAASIWRRDWPWLGGAAFALGLSSEQVDQMFIFGATL